MAKTKTLKDVVEARTPEWGANQQYAFCDVFGGDAVLFSDKVVPGWWEHDPPAPSQHPTKAGNPGGHMRWFGDE